MTNLEFRLRIEHLRIKIAWYNFKEKVAAAMPARLKSKERLAREAAENEPWEPMRCYNCMRGHHSHSQDEQPERTAEK